LLKLTALTVKGLKDIFNPFPDNCSAAPAENQKYVLIEDCTNRWHTMLLSDGASKILKFAVQNPSFEEFCELNC
jgi:hypothetical protein